MSKKPAPSTGPDGQKMVPVRLIRAKDDPETLPVTINGTLWNVPLGVETSVPENVALVLIHSGHIDSYPGFSEEIHPGVKPEPKDEE